MCPMLLVPLNLPQSLRISPRSIMLAGIIPGPAEVKNTDPYLDVLVDEILDLHNKPVYDALHDQVLNLQISITLNILDYPGQNKVFHCQGMHGRRCRSGWSGFGRTTFWQENHTVYYCRNNEGCGSVACYIEACAYSEQLLVL